MNRFAVKLLVVALCITASAGFALRFGQDVSWDFQNYHYYSGYAFLHKAPGYDFAPAQVQSFFNPLLHVPTYLLTAHLPARVTAALLGAVQGFNLVLVFLISQQLFRRWPGPYRHAISLVNAAAGFYGTVQIEELGTTFGDTLITIPILAALLLIVRSIPSEGTAGRKIHVRFAVAGILSGVAFGLKLTALFVVAALPIGILIAFARSRGRMKLAGVFCAGLVVGFVAVYGFWGIHLYREYGNPVFPYLNQVFHSPYYGFEDSMDARFLPRTWQETVFYPFFFAHRNTLVSEIKFRDIRLALGYICLVLLGITGVWRRLRGLRKKSGDDHSSVPPVWFFAVFLAVSYALWQHFSSIYRYIPVLELLIPTFLALVLSSWFQNRMAIVAFALALDLAICNSVIPVNFGRQPFQEEFWKVQVPPIADLESSVVLMAGTRATSYIVPSFPVRTRFVRVSANFLRPGLNSNLDRKITGMLSSYDAAHTFVYVAATAEMEMARADADYYGVKLDLRSCRELSSSFGPRGFLCGVSEKSAPVLNR